MTRLLCGGGFLPPLYADIIIKGNLKLCEDYFFILLYYFYINSGFCIVFSKIMYYNIGKQDKIFVLIGNVLH